MKKTISAFAALIAIGVAACSPDPAPAPVPVPAPAPAPAPEPPAPVPEQKPETVDAAHNSENSLDWDGVYSGTIPAASGPGIEVTITLRTDLTYTLRQHYVDREGDFTETGSFKWSTDGRVITLDAKDTPPYQVGENQLIQLDMEGKPITGELADQYVLKKQTPEPIPENVDAAHNSENSLDWDGVYSGTIPAASGPGIEMTITLRNDLTYTRRQHYVGREGEFTETGSFKWSADGSAITLDAKDSPHYKVGENQLIQLDMEGKPITGELADRYVLRKQP